MRPLLNCLSLLLLCFVFMGISREAEKKKKEKLEEGEKERIIEEEKKKVSRAMNSVKALRTLLLLDTENKYKCKCKYKRNVSHPLRSLYAVVRSTFTSGEGLPFHFSRSPATHIISRTIPC